MDNAQHTLTSLPEDILLASVPCLCLNKHLPAALPSPVTCPAHYILVTCVFQGQLGFYFLFCYFCYNCCCRRRRFGGWLRRWRWCLYRCGGLWGLKRFFRVRAPGENQRRDWWAERRFMFAGLLGNAGLSEPTARTSATRLPLHFPKEILHCSVPSRAEYDGCGLLRV